MLTIGIDSGTQSTKTIVLDPGNGDIVAAAQQAYGFVEGLPPGHLEQEPRWWVDAVEATVQQCLQKIGSRKDEIAAIGVSGQQHGLVALDQQSVPVRPAKLWCDTSTTKQCDEFSAKFGGAKGLIDLAGNTILPGYTAPKILWLKQNEPHNYAAAVSFLLPHDYINFWLTGEKRMEFGDASGTGLMNVRERVWCKSLVDFIDPELERTLPTPETSRRAAGLLREDLRTRWGLKNSPIVSAGGGDNMMGALGTGNVRPGILTASLGTSGTLYACAETPVIDPEGDVAAFCDSNDRWLPLVCTMNVTVATEQARALFGWDHARLEAEIAAIEPGADGLIFLPYLNGERTPNLPRGTGVFHGLTTANMTPAHMARAVMEGATLGLAYGLSRLRSLGVQADEVRLTGGGSKSAIWRQIAADVFGAPTVCLTSPEGAALGAAIQALFVTKAVSGSPVPLREITKELVQLNESTRATPNPAARELYEELLGRQTQMTRRLHSLGFL